MAPVRDNSFDPFHDAKLKLNRARSHALEMSSRLEEYSKQYPYDLVVAKSPVTGGNALKIVTLDPLLPAEIGLALGDTVHNLRCALDHLAFGTVGLFCDENEVRKLYFPIAESEEGVRNSFSFRMFHRHQPLLARAILEEVQPFKGSNDLLWNLQLLNNVDKHRMLIPLVRVLRLTGVYASGPSTALNNTTLEMNGAGEAEFISLGGEYRVTSKGTPHLRLTFRGSDPFGNQEVMSALQLAGSAVAEVINRIERAFREGGGS